jgi:hypothetical protein
MTFAASTIPAFTAALLAGLIARQELAGVSVVDGPAPPKDFDRSELIELLDVTEDEEVHALDRTTQPRAEKCVMTVLITVQKAGRTNQAVVNARAFVLLDALNQLLRGDPYLAAYYTGPGRIYGARITTKNHKKRVTPDNTVREASVEVGVRWEGRI